MPLSIIKKVWDYCSYSMWFLAFIFILLLVSEFIQNYVQVRVDYGYWMVIQFIIFALLAGYGMQITRDRINHGVRLPKIIIKDVVFFGFKATIVYFFYFFIQGYVLDFICSPLNFPNFNLEEMLFHWSDTLYMLYYHNPIKTIIFLVVGSILFYCTVFFMEIALARLADTRSMLQSFNFIAIVRNISTFGWRNYARDYTIIVLAIVILLFLESFQLPNPILDDFVDTLLEFLIFATQYLGIGAVYCDIKDMERELVE